MIAAPESFSIFSTDEIPQGVITDAAADALAALLWNAAEGELQAESQAEHQASETQEDL